MRALLLDYGGVLTAPITPSFTAFEQAHGIPAGHTLALVIDASRTADAGLIGALERGELAPGDFEQAVVDLYARDGYEVPASGLLAGLFAAMQPAGRLWDLARRARQEGIRTGLLSNTWGTDAYPQSLLEAHFDVQVLSAHVGLRKPDPAIYALACQRLGVAPRDTVFVDDLPHNIEAARALGMTAIWHHDDDLATVEQVAEHLGLDAGPDGWQLLAEPER